MADPRTFVLIGNFEDNITPALTKINNSVDSFKRNMATLSTKKGGGYNDVTQAVGKLVSAQKHLKTAIQDVGAAARAATGDLKDYKKQVGGVARAHFAIARATSQAARNETQFWNQAKKSAESYARFANSVQARRPTRAGMPPMQMPTGRRYGGGGGGGGSRPPGGGGGGGGGYNFHMGAFSFGMELGQGLAQPISTAIFSGFQMGVGLMAKTMEYVQSSFAERVEDQMTDLQTAGGYYAISKRQKDPMFTGLQSAIRFTQETNLVLSRLASDLPGSTQDYVKVSKRIGDSVMRLVDQNEKGSIAYAQQLIAKGGLQETYKDISLEGPGAREGAISVILGELTKKTVLAGFGGTTGRGGAAGPYGLPALMERLITQPDTSMASLNKYASVFGDPKIMAGLERAEEKLKKAGSNMLERAKVVNEFLDEVVPPEMIAAMRKSMAGMAEAYRSAFFDPEMGLFGFGRKLGDEANKADKLLQPLTDEFGRFVKEEIKNGKKIYTVVTKAKDASQVSLGIFDMLADIISNYGAILKPIVDNLYLLWDPMQGLAMVLKDVRIISTQLLDLFRTYDDALKQEVEALEAAGKKGLAKQLGMTRSLRTSLLTIFDIFTDLGAISEGDFKKYRAAIIDPAKSVKDLANLVKTAVTTFFDSDAGFNAGKFVGEMLREVAISLSEFTGFISQLGATQLAEGFMAGFGTEGIQAVEKIFRDIYTLLFEAAKAIIPRIPWQVYALSAASVIIPAAVSGLAMAFAQAITEMISAMGRIALGQIAKRGGAADVITDVIEQAPKPKANYGGIPYSPFAPPDKPAPAPPKPTVGSRFKNFLKASVGADDSVLGRPLVNLVKSIRASLSGLVGKLATLKPMFSSFGMFIDVLADALGAFAGLVPGVKQLASFIEDWMDFGFQPAMANAAKGFKNFFAGGKGALGGLLGKGKGLLGALFGGAKGAAGGLKGLFGKGLKGLGKFGGIATAAVGIIESVMSLLSGDSLGTALGKGAGPVLGTIIGTALLGPIGGMIGGWIGSMEAVTEPLGQAFESIIQTLGVTFKFLGQAGKDLLGVLNWVGKGLFGMGKGFDALRFVIFALVSPFRLLELGIRGLYVLYLQMKANLGLASKEEKETLEKEKVALNRRTQQFVIEGEEARGVSKRDQLEKAKVDLAALQAEREALKAKPGRKPPRAYRGPSEAEKNLQLRIETLEGLTKGEPTKPSTPAKETPKNIQEIAEQTTTQVKEIGKVQTGTEKTTAAVKDLTTKITAQTSVQSTVAAIYNLLASGSLRVNGVGFMPPGGGGGGGANPPKPSTGSNWLNKLYADPLTPITPQNPLALPVSTTTYPSSTLGDIETFELIVPSGAKVSKDVTFGDINMTVNAQEVSDPDALATLVALKFGEAVADARGASIFR